MRARPRYVRLTRSLAMLGSLAAISGCASAVTPAFDAARRTDGPPRTDTPATVDARDAPATVDARDALVTVDARNAPDVRVVLADATGDQPGPCVDGGPEGTTCDPNTACVSTPGCGSTHCYHNAATGTHQWTTLECGGPLAPPELAA